MERFPLIAIEIPAAGKGELKREAIPPVSLESVEVLYFYGIGVGEGYEEAVSWLRGSPKRKLVLLEDDLDKIASFLHHKNAAKVLRDPQVVLARLGEFDELAERFPVNRIEVFALPSKGSVKKLKETLLLKTAFAHALHLDRVHGYQHFQNFVCNLRRLPRSFYANKLQGKFRGIPAIVCGAGPSLKEATPWLRTMENRALLIAGGSTLAALSSQGILPHFGMAVDPNLEEYRRLKNSFAFEVPLLYSTRVFPAIFQAANGPFGYMRTGVGGVSELWMEEELGLLDPLIGTHLSNDAISVTSTCLAFAQFLGCSPILLSGVDLAYTGKKRYAPGVAEESLDLDEETGSVDRIVRKRDRQGKIVYTAVRWLIESNGFSHFATMHPETEFINTTPGGIGFKKIPYRPLEDAAASFEAFDFSLRGKVHEEISRCPMPAHTAETIQTRLGELKESLGRTLSHLEICAGVKQGSVPLAQIELVEEMAYSYLFYDAAKILQTDLELEGKGPEEKWMRFLKLAKCYQAMLKNFF